MPSVNTLLEASGSQFESFIHIENNNPELADRIYNLHDYSNYIPDTFIMKNIEILFKFPISPISGINLQLYILSLLLVLFDKF